MTFLNFLVHYRAEILSRTLEHLLLVAAAMLAAVLVGIPLGIALVGRQSLRRWVLGAANVIGKLRGGGGVIELGCGIPLRRPRQAAIGGDGAATIVAFYHALRIIR